ncbi:hypothetical protein GCM10008908_06090 [Clostridium subterminale]|uniref:Uncharacterized protein n=1 Tax=Clostridium subterminale TaxID=1550 RepID=A0ABN1KIC0_CLOSU
MNRIWSNIIGWSLILLLLGMMYMAERNFTLSKKMLKIQHKIFIPILIVLTIIKWIKTGQFLGEKNSYSLFLIISLVSLCSELLNKFIPKYFRCYSMNDIYFDDRNYRYVISLGIFNFCMTFMGIATIMLFIDDFIIKLGIR